MKKLVLLFVILISAQAAFCESEKITTLRTMEDSFKAQNQICLNVAKNFKLDSQTSNFLKNECVIYQMRRQRILPILFPMTSDNGSDYKANYRTMMAEYAVKMDKQQIEYLKQITAEYCKHNSYRFVKNDPAACTRVNSLFVEF